MEMVASRDAELADKDQRILELERRLHHAIANVAIPYIDLEALD